MNYIEKKIDEINEKYIPIIRKILKLNAEHFIDVKVSTPEDDMKKATDFNIEIIGGTVAVRVRFDDETYKRNGKIYRDFTIRSKSRYGHKTELHKLREGFAKWYLYLWHRRDSFYDWIVVDMDIVRDSGILNIKRDEIPNNDGTKFISIPIKELKENFCVINLGRKDGVSKSA